MGPVSASLNFVVRLRASISGPADPIQSTLPQSANSIRAILGSSTAAGSYNVRPSGPVTSGFLVGYANDFSPLSLTTPAQTFTLTQPVTVQFIAQCYQTVLYNGVPPFPRVGASDTDVQISFPCGTPVFNLPPGVTANSVSLGIVNNLWMHASCGSPNPCPADFNGDTIVDPDDLADYITCFFGEQAVTGSCPTADFSGDTIVDPDDLADFIAAFFGSGC